MPYQSRLKVNRISTVTGNGTSAYDKAAENGVDPRCIPKYLDGTPPIGCRIVTPDYSEEDETNWGFLFNRQMQLLQVERGKPFSTVWTRSA